MPEKVGVITIRKGYDHFTYVYKTNEGRSRALVKYLTYAVKRGYYGEQPGENLAPKRALSPDELGYFNLSESKINELPEELRETLRNKHNEAQLSYQRALRRHEEDLRFWKPINKLLSVSEDQAIKIGDTVQGVFMPLIDDIMLTYRGYVDNIDEEEEVELLS